MEQYDNFFRNYDDGTQQSSKTQIKGLVKKNKLWYIVYITNALIDTICWENLENYGEFPGLLVFLAAFFRKFDKQLLNVSISAWVLYHTILMR